MSGTLSSSLLIDCSSFCCEIDRFDFGTKLIISAALRTPTAPPGMRPPSTNTLCTSGRLRRRFTMSLVTASVSESCEPGGSSMASSEREMSETGRKPDAQELRAQSESPKSPKPTSTVMKRSRIAQPIDVGIGAHHRALRLLVGL